MSLPASELELLYDYETHFETAVKNALTAAGLRAYRQRDADDLVTPFCVIQFQGGAATEHRGKSPPSQHIYPDIFDGCTLTVGIVTTRTKNDDDHAIYRRRARATIYDWRRTFDGDDLPYYEIVWLQETGTSAIIEDDNRTDISAITWEVRFGIVKAAWPHR